MIQPNLLEELAIAANGGREARVPWLFLRNIAFKEGGNDAGWDALRSWSANQHLTFVVEWAPDSNGKAIQWVSFSRL